MSNHQDDLDLLLSLQDRVLETPPASPSTYRSQSPDLSDDEFPKRSTNADMSVFRDAVQDYLELEPEPNPEPSKEAPKLNRSKISNDANIEKFSGLRIRNQLVSPVELANRFLDIRFVRLSTIENLLMGDTLSGCWATVGVLTEKGSKKTSSTGKSYCIWKFGCLDEKTISVFLFGDAYQRNCKEKAGTAFALFNGNVRKDAMGKGFSLSVYSVNQILKIGISVDFGVCKGKRKDGLACTMVINKRRGIYCQYHKSKAPDKYSTVRSELKGGILRTDVRPFRDSLKSEGIYLVDPLANKTNVSKPKQPVKLLSVEGLKKALSNAGKVTTNSHSQGIRFLTEVTGKMSPRSALPSQKMSGSGKRLSSTMKLDPSPVTRKQQEDAKRKKTEPRQDSAGSTKQPTEKMIELDFVSSDEDI